MISISFFLFVVNLVRIDSLPTTNINELYSKWNIDNSIWYFRTPTEYQLKLQPVQFVLGLHSHRFSDTKLVTGYLGRRFSVTPSDHITRTFLFDGNLFIPTIFSEQLPVYYWQLQFLGKNTLSDDLSTISSDVKSIIWFHRLIPTIYPQSTVCVIN